MAIKLDIQTTGVSTLERAVAAFDKMSGTMGKTAVAFDKLTKTEQQLVRWFEKMAEVAKLSTDQLKGMKDEATKTTRELSAMAMSSAKQPFSALSRNMKEARIASSAFRLEMKQLNADMAGTSGAAMLDKAAIVSDKAALVLLQKINAETEKQAQLRAKIATIKGDTDYSATLKDTVANLKAAEAETARYAASLDKLIAKEERAAAAEKQLANARAAAAEKQLANARASLSQGAAVAATKTSTTSGVASGTTPSGFIIDPKVFDRQNAALSKLQSRLKSLKGSVPTETFNQLRVSIGKATAAMELNGTSQTKVIAGISKTVAGYEKLAAAEIKAAGGAEKMAAANLKVAGTSGTLQGAIRGTAGALGGLWLSYGNILPMMAAFAAAGSVKSVYELGAAFEYTTTYVDALNDAVGGLDAGQIQKQLLGLEGLRKTPSEMADGMKEFAKAGVEASESVGQIAEMSKFATLAEMGLGEATKMVIGQSNAFGTTFADSANMIASAALSSATDIGELGNALSYTTELATISKVQFDEVATALALMANAGIRGCYDRDTEVLTKRGWKRWEDVTYDDEFATYNSTVEEIEYQQPDRLIRYHHKGKMYKVANKGVDLCVTPEHRMYVKKQGQGEFGVLTAEEIAGKPVSYKTGGLGWSGEPTEEVTLPGFSQPRGSWVKEVEPTTIDAETWATFLGWYIADGHCNKDKGNYRVVITKTNHKPVMQAKMRRVFDLLPWTYNYTESTGQFCFTNQQLFNALHPLGQVYDKHIPQYAKEWEASLLEILFQSLMECDGDKENRYYTSSTKLRDDVQEIALKLGYSTLHRKTIERGEVSVFTGGRQMVAGADGWRVSVSRKRTEPKWNPGSYKGVHGARLKGSKIEIFEGWVDYDDEVFCAEVPNGLLIVRRNGRAVVSGNSKAGTAIRTSILKMQAPTSTFKKELDALGISWTAFTEGGQVKSLKVMFTELKRATENLPDAKRVKLLKDLFGLRSLKGGANILKSMGGEWDAMNMKIKESTEGVSFISEKYEEVADTVIARWERLGNEIQKVLLQAFDSETTKGIIDSLTASIVEGNVLQTLESIVAVIGSIGEEMAKIVRFATALPGDLVDYGVLGYVMFGTSAPGKVLAVLYAAQKVTTKAAEEGMQKIKQTAATADLHTLYSLPTDDLDAMNTELERMYIASKQINSETPLLTTWLRRKWDSVIGGESSLKYDSGFLDYKQSLMDTVLSVEIDVIPQLKFSDGVAGLQEKLDKAYAEQAAGRGPSSGYTQSLENQIEAAAKIKAQLDNALQSSGTDTPEYKADLAHLAAIKDVMDSIDYDHQAKGLSEWELGLREIEKKLEKIQEDQVENDGVGFSGEELYKIRVGLEDDLVSEEIEKLQQDLEKLNFKTMINGMKEAGTETDKYANKVSKIKANYLELKESAFKSLKAIDKRLAWKDEDNTIHFSVEGAKQFEAMIKNANLFKGAIKDLNKEIKNMEDSLSDSTFSMNQAIAKAASAKNPNLDSDKFDYQQAIAASEHYAAEAKRALDGTLEGRKRAIEMYEKAFSTEQGLTPETTAGINAQVQGMQYLRDQIVALKKEDIISAEKAVKDLGTEQQAAQDYIDSIVKGYGTIEAAVESHGKILLADGQKMTEWKNGQMTNIDAVIAKWKELNSNQFSTAGGLDIVFPESASDEAIQAAKDYGTTLNASKEATIDLNKLTEEAAEKTKENWSGMKAGVEGSTEAMSAGAKGVVTFGGKTYTWSKNSVKAVDSVTASWKELAKTINNMPTASAPSASSDFGGGKALGGPVSSGSTYLVGEKGPELFAPRTSGVIIPNNRLGGASEKMVDINLSIGGGVSVPLKGSQTSIDEIYKQMKTKARYAG